MKRNIMILAGLITVAMALAACAPAVSTSAGEPARQIVVTGNGVVYVVPDLAYINVGVHSIGDSVGEAMDANKAQATAIKDTLVAQGVAEGDIQTSSFNVYPQSDYDYQGAVTRNYFSVDNTVYVTVRDLDKLGAILDAVAASGANNIYGITFDVTDKTAAQSSARKIAVDSAMAQAKELADAAGVGAGEILSISSSYSYPSYGYGYGMGGGGGAEYAASVPIAAGQIQVTADVTMTFAIE
ncbi:MAG: SIMPL domain-containing protein [Anaerolineae bacterium]|nr:SIMPL domain-containing protein [Anaerolineae bacterium]